MNEHLFPKPFESDLALVLPPFQRLIVSMENIGIEYIASYARAQSFDVRIINAGLHGLTSDDVIRILKQSRFRVLGISTIHWTMASALDIARAVKLHHPGCHIVMGGIEAALNAERLLTGNPFIDSIGMGEGEHIVAELLSAISKGDDWRGIRGLAYRGGEGVVFGPTPDLVDPLDQLPQPARDDLGAVLDSGGPVSVSTSRGCFGRCSFCSVRAFYDLSKGRCWRGRTPASVVDEIRELHENHGVKLFSFIDETVIGPGPRGMERLREMAALIGERGLEINFFMTIRADQVEKNLFGELKRAGLKKVEIGIESMAETQLRRYGKTATVDDNRRALRVLEELGIGSEAFMIPYDPDVTRDELKKNLSFYRERFENKSDLYDVAPLTMGDYLYPYPGTGTRALYEKMGWLGPDYHTPFRANDETIQRVQQAVHWFIAFVESAFPMSFAGLGNLWVNGRGLPGPVYRKTCIISKDLGNLLVEITEWAYRTSSKPSPFSIVEREEISLELGNFLAKAAGLKREVGKIIEAHGGHSGHRLPPGPGDNSFTEELYLFGKKRRRSIINNMYSHGLDEKYIASVITGLLTEQRKQACHE